MMKRKHLSSVANDVVQRCAQELAISVDTLVREFEGSWNIESSGYSRKFVEFCCTKALTQLCQYVKEKVTNGSYSRFTFDMMLSWEMPSSEDEEAYTKCVGKEREEKKIQVNIGEEQDDIPLFYSDIMPLLVDHGPSIGEDTFVWLGSLVPLAVDMVNGRFTFETLTASTGNRLHFPAYDLFIKEIDKCVKHLQKQQKPKGVEMADDEFILHVEGTASSQRVVRHIGGTSWPGRLTLTNYALYFEASGVITYEDALKIDLAKDTDRSVKPAQTGPWGAPLFDKGICYESSELSEAIVLEFPEITSSTRRDHWLALIKEVMLMHQFLSEFKVESPIQEWEMHARTILGAIRLHAAREMIRISPPDPRKFLIFALFDEIPKGDYVLEELAESLKRVKTGHPCSASSILRSMNLSESTLSSVEVNENDEGDRIVMEKDEKKSSLETAIDKSWEEAKEVEIAKATTEELKEEGISESAVILMELVKPLKDALPLFQKLLSWEKPLTTLSAFVLSIIIIYKEWVGRAITAILLWIVAKMLRARQERVRDKCNEIIVSTATGQTSLESIISAQYGLITLHELMQEANVAILKMWSIYVSKAYKHANMVMMVLSGLAILFAVIPLKFIIIVGVSYLFVMWSSLMKSTDSKQAERRLKEWWDSIPVILVRVVSNQIPDNPKIV